MTDSAETLRVKLKRAEESLVGVRLLALEMDAEVRALKVYVNSPGPSMVQTASAVASLAHLDVLLEPMFTAGKGPR